MRRAPQKNVARTARTSVCLSTISGICPSIPEMDDGRELLHKSPIISYHVLLVAFVVIHFASEMFLMVCDD